ncbi:MAG: alpha/beta hydrolase [Actinomycetota bacterium]|nr:alpha/beta hydrolase [Actinomycetota bacterium]
MLSLRARGLRLIMRRAKPTEERTLEEDRENFKKITRYPPPRTVSCEEITLGGITSLRFTPRNPEPDSHILYLHGGGYMMGSPEIYRSPVGLISNMTNTVVTAVDYRLAPENPYPAGIEDCVTAYLALKDETGDTIAVAGDSAGGGATLATAVSLRDNHSLSPSCLYLISPWLDLTHSGESMKTKGGVDVMLAPDWIRTAADRYRGDEDASNPGISPLFADLKDLPPMLIQVGDEELLLSDSERLADLASKVGVKVEIEIAKGLWHVYPLFGGFIPEGKKSLKEAVRFINEHNKSENKPVKK